MARIQILELPEGSSDDRPPFVLVVDESVPQRYILGPDDNPAHDYWQDIAQQIGARGVIVTPETVDIPANDTTAYLDTAATPEASLKLDDHDVRGAIAADMNKAREQAGLPTLGQQLADERTDIARDTDRLAKWKNEITDALGIDRFRYWEDIRNAAAGMRQERDALAAEVERLRAGEEPVTDERIAPNPGQWIWKWNRATPEKRLNMAAQILSGMTRASDCFTQNHEARLADLSIEVERLRAERAASGQPRA